MALIPEHINIKRRREEEPPETLYIQNKRRFTDFVFQRVRVEQHHGGGLNGHTSASSQLTTAAAPSLAVTGNLQNPRAVSTPGILNSNSVPPSTKDRGPAQFTDEGVPIVRATSPGAAARADKEYAAARRAKEEKMRQALMSGPVPASATVRIDGSALNVQRGPAKTVSPSASQTNLRGTTAPSLRRFNIARNASSSNLLKAAGIQKRKFGGPAPAVLIEQVTRNLSPKKSATMLNAIAGGQYGDTPSEDLSSSITTPSRKRPVVNQTEKQWREGQKTSVSAAKTKLLDSSREKDDTEEDRLARELEKFAMTMDNEDTAVNMIDTSSSPPPLPAAVAKKVPQKFKPKHTARQRKPVSVISPGEGTGQSNAAGNKLNAAITPQPSPAQRMDPAEDSEGEYIYETYVRRPIQEILANPISDYDADNDTLYRELGIDLSRKDIGLVVITEEDEELWASLVEVDVEDDKWNTDDEDSNAEDNPANDYPEDELSEADEEDDPTAIYRRYRHGGSDDEAFDLNDEDDDDFGFGRHYSRDRYDSDEDLEQALHQYNSGHNGSRARFGDDEFDRF